MDSLNRRVNGYNYGPNSTTEYQRFKSEYFTGADIRIYFGDVWVDEITSLQFTLQEQVAPIFGYASYTWDKVARGNRYIQGSFTINFKETYYLHSVLNRLSSVMKANSSSAPAFNTTKWKEGVDIEHLIDGDNPGQFDKLADEFEKTLWGESTDNSMKKTTKLRSKDTFFYPEHRGANDESGGATYDGETSQKVLAENGFNIIIAYGPMNEVDGMKASETAHSLIGVQLTGVSQVVDGNGQAIQEQYTFIAKDLDGDVTVAPRNNVNYSS
jgi:hypothetical protein